MSHSLHFFCIFSMDHFQCSDSVLISNAQELRNENSLAEEVSSARLWRCLRKTNTDHHFPYVARFLKVKIMLFLKHVLCHNIHLLKYPGENECKSKKYDACCIFVIFGCWTAVREWWRNSYFTVLGHPSNSISFYLVILSFISFINNILGKWKTNLS